MLLTMESLLGTEPVWFHKYNYDEAEQLYYSRGSVKQRAAGGKVSSKQTDKPVKKASEDVVLSAKNTDSKLSIETLFGPEAIWFNRYEYDIAEQNFYSLKTSVPPSCTAHTKESQPINTKLTKKEKKKKEKKKKALAKKRESNQKTDNEVQLSENKEMPVSVESILGTEQIWFQRYNVEEAEEIFYSKGKVKPRVPETAAEKPAADDEDDIDLFGDDEPDPEAEAIKAQRLKEYQERKAKKPAAVAKSSVVLEIKPWDDETDLAKLEESVRSIDMDGLVWGASRLVPVAFGIKKLQIQLVVEDDKVSIDALSEKISEFEDYVQSVDIAAFNKI